jgi:hypothetical protein
MENETNMPQEKPVTVVISRQVLPGHDRDYIAWVHRLVDAATEAPGNTGATMLTPGPGKPGLYHAILRFTDAESVHRWEDSYIRQKLSHEADAFSVKSRQEATGMETWFSIPECPELTTPPQWKMFLITTLAVYAMSVLFVKLEELLKLNWNFYLLNILTSALVVGALTWAVMPWFSRYIFRKWLYKE